MIGAEEILEYTESLGGTAFPLGAGGGGAVFIMTSNLKDLNNIKEGLQSSYCEIKFKIKSKGHEFINIQHNTF
jgi:hypothetical protein